MMTKAINNWRKSSFSGNGGTSCVGTGWDETTVGYLDTKQGGLGEQPDQPVLLFSKTAAKAFLTGARAGQFKSNR